MRVKKKNLKSENSKPKNLIFVENGEKNGAWV